jgi:hypothetical protein
MASQLLRALLSIVILLARYHGFMGGACNQSRASSLDLRIRWWMDACGYELPSGYPTPDGAPTQDTTSTLRCRPPPEPGINRRQHSRM